MNLHCCDLHVIVWPDGNQAWVDGLMADLSGRPVNLSLPPRIATLFAKKQN